MQVFTNRNRNLATFRASKDALEAPDSSRIVLHEVLHLPFDTIREEFDFIVTELQRERLLSPSRAISYTERHDREIEKVVEHLSHVLYDQLSKPQ